jgi:glycosyltransferase involved in cell wall biosynthesis
MLSKNTPFFTVIIPTFDSGKTLAISLESIARQSHKNVEILIIDGASQDDTLAIANGYKDQLPGLKVFSEKDQGIYDAMNKGMDNTTGKWVYFMGSDDRFFNENVLQNIAGFIETTEAKVIYGNAKILGDTGWAKDGEIYAGEFDLHKLLNQNICHQAMFYNRAFVKDEIGEFNLDYKKSSDWDLNLRCWAKQPFAYIDLTVAYFAAGGFSTHSNDTRIYDDFVDNVLKYFKISPFHELVNRSSFAFYGKVLKKQQQDHPIRFTFEKLKRKFAKKMKLN